jgi:hypothetical protein
MYAWGVGGGLAVAVGIMTGCGSSPTGTQANKGGPCTPSGTVNLAVNQGMTLSCTSGSQVTLTGAGATYLVVPQFAAGDVPYILESYSLGLAGNGGPVGAARIRAVSPTSAEATGIQGGNPLVLSSRALRNINRRQTTFDLKMLAANRKRSLSGVRTVRAGPTAKLHEMVSCHAPTIGSLCTFNVIANEEGTSFKAVIAALEYIGNNVYVYIDTTAPQPGFSGASLTTFGGYADTFLYPLDVNTFGAPTNTDGLGHVIMLLTPVVNGLTPSAECATQGFVAGFFNSADLNGDREGNGGEIFYTIVPDPTGRFSCSHTVADIEALTPGVFLHELQHMINYGHHVILNRGNAEEGWLDEGESIVATELGARYYQAKYPVGGRTNPNQLFPDSAESFITEHLIDSYNYLTLPETASVTLHTDADCCLAWRAGDWLLLRYLGDQYDSTVYARLENGSVTGTANLAAASGISFSQLFGNFGIAIYADSLPGVPRTPLPSPYRFAPPHNLRQYYQALYNVAAGQDGVTTPFPITVQGLSGSGSVSGAMVPGTVSFYELTTPAGSPTVTINFAPSGGGTFSSNLQAQVNVYRLN